MEPATWLTVAQAAEYTGYSVHTIRDAAQTGALKATRRATAGGRAPYRFTREDLDTWMTSGDRTQRRTA